MRSAPPGPAAWAQDAQGRRPGTGRIRQPPSFGRRPGPRAETGPGLHADSGGGQGPPASRPGKELVAFSTGEPRNPGDGLGRSCRRCGQGRTSPDRAQVKGGVAGSRHSAATPLGPGPASAKSRSSAADGNVHSRWREPAKGRTGAVQKSDVGKNLVVNDFYPHPGAVSR